MSFHEIMDAAYNRGLIVVSGFMRGTDCTAYWVYQGETEIMSSVGLMDIERYLNETR